MPLIFQKRIYREDLRANADVHYVFGDNERRLGLGGQAGEMRDEPNAIGVATLRAPGVPWTDDEFDRQCAVLDADMLPIRKALQAGDVVIFPLDGIGTGIAAMPDYAPRTFRYLTDEIQKLASIP